MSLPAPYYQDSAVTIYHGDCGQILPFLGRFDLLLTDPPYGIGENNSKNLSRTRKGRDIARPKDYGDFEWDSAPISRWLLHLIIASADKLIIWGGNYYPLPPCKGPLVWDKLNSGDFADGELAWNNLGTAVRIKRHMWNGMLRKDHEERFHPTQKPVEVMSWCISLAEPVATILDPFAGSGTTGRAAKDWGKKATLIERVDQYCEIAAKRMSQEVLPLWDIVDK
jgi:DNA modification methylase